MNFELLEIERRHGPSDSCLLKRQRRGLESLSNGHRGKSAVDPQAPFRLTKKIDLTGA